MLLNDPKAVLSQSFLFRSVSRDKIDSILQDLPIEVETYEKGDVICAPDCFQNRIGIVASGKCEIWRTRNKTDNVLLNTILPCGSFGVLSVLSDNRQFPTHVVAKTRSKIIYINGADLITLIKTNGDIAINVISFLANRCDFLNSKVSTFSSSTVEQKLAKYLLETYYESHCFELTVSKAKLALKIGAGRASLYRALDSLSNQNILIIESKKIIIKNLDELERISK